MDQPIINALIAVFLALGSAVSDGTVHRAGKLLRELIADGVVDPATTDILESVLAATDEADGTRVLDDVFEQLAAVTRH